MRIQEWTNRMAKRKQLRPWMCSARKRNWEIKLNFAATARKLERKIFSRLLIYEHNNRTLVHVNMKNAVN